MNRRSFIASMLLAGVGSMFLPGASRRWVKQLSPVELWVKEQSNLTPVPIVRYVYVFAQQMDHFEFWRRQQREPNIVYRYVPNELSQICGVTFSEQNQLVKLPGWQIGKSAGFLDELRHREFCSRRLAEPLVES